MSMDVTSSTVIPRPVADVWAYLVDPANDVTWTSGLLEARPLTEGGLRPGARVERVSKFLGRRMTYTIDVIEVDEGRSIRMKTSAGPFPIEVTYLLEPADGGTRFSIRNQGEPSGFFALTGPLLAAAVRRQVQLDVETLRDLLTAG
jgi:hypothetical protein